ncbi:MAG: hypothetical protein ABI467_00010 [Kofleriaceae bacterium]
MAGLDDGRIPCPLCGGLVHPVAGRCKHCKQDLSPLRTGRAAAALPLPALHGNGAVADAMPRPVPRSMPWPMPGPMPGPIAAGYPPNAGPVLPPRVTGQSAAVRAPKASWKSWPMVVIVLASIAIVVAVVLMVWPPSRADAGRKMLSQPPAPERMDSDPLPPPGAGNTNGADPWGGHSQADPAPVQPRVTPDPLPPKPPAVDPVPDPPDPSGGAVFQAVLAHACTKLESCPNPDDTVTAMCDAFAMFPKAPPPTCDAATRCFEAIDKLDCAADLDQMSPGDVMMKMQDCMTAATTC